MQYAVTFTLSRILRKLSSEDQYDVIRNHIYDDHKPLFHGWKLTLICELTRSFDVHLHGIMNIEFMKLPIKYWRKPERHIQDIVKNNPKLLGFCCLKQMTDYNGWVSYFSKSLKDTKDILSRPSIIVDQFNVFPNGAFPQYNDNEIDVDEDDIPNIMMIEKNNGT